MNCDKCRELFDDYVDQELAEPRLAKFQAHLDRCVRCTLEFKVYTTMVQSIERLEEDQVPGDLNAIVMKGVQTTQTAWNPQTLSRSGAAVWGWTIAFGGALFLLMGSLLFKEEPKVADLPPAQMVVDERPMVRDIPRGDDVTRNATVPRSAPELALVRHEGDVDVMELGATDWKKVDEKSVIHFGDRVRTGSSGVAGLEFPGEVALRIKPGSLVQVVSNTELRMFSGNTWVMVRKKGRAFSVETPNAVASVRGTKFSVETMPLNAPYATEMADGLTGLSRSTVASPDLALFGTRVGVELMARMHGVKLLSELSSKVSVYESSVWTAARQENGQFGQTEVLKEGFGVQVAMSRVDKPQLLTEGDFLGWRSVMVYEPEVLDRARSSLMPSSATGVLAPPVSGAEPTSTSGPTPVEGFGDVNRSSNR